MPTRLHAVDLGIVGLYLVAITLFGLRFSRKRKGEAAQDKSLRGYFLANRTIPWWAIALSIVSAETSTLTIIGTPALAYAGDFGFLQIVFGYMLGRVVVSAIFLPKYFHGEMLTAYQLIDRRFGHGLHKVTAGLFLLTRAAAEGVRVFAVSIVVGIAIGTGDVLSIGIISALTLLYTFEGGMAAVIWTDVVQMAIYVGGTVVAIATLGSHVPGGWHQIHVVAGAAGKFHMLNFAVNLTQTYTFWAGVLGGTFLTMASHGTDQLMVQRMLAAKNLGESRLALLSSGVVIFVQFALFLLIGAGLFVFYGLHPRTFANPNMIFPTFIVREMPVGVAGLLVAAILAAAMSNLSAALNSLSSTTVVDFYMNWRPAADDRERMLVSRASTVGWAVVLFGVAVYSVSAGGKGNVVEIGLSIASVAYGCLLGVFLLGTLTKYATQMGAIMGMITGFAVNVALWKQPAAIHLGGFVIPKVAYTWYVLIGAVVTFAVGSVASVVLRPRVRGAVTVVVLIGVLCGNGWAQGQGVTNPTSGVKPPDMRHPEFGAVSALIEEAIAGKKLPGTVVVVGHGGKIVFEQAYGVRKLAGEPGLDGKPSAAEPMTVDTIFDMASLTKCLATATAIMQLYEAHKLDFDDPVVKYLPEFGVNGKEHVTIRELLTHYSGLPPDVSLKDVWGLAKPDKAEGIKRAMEAGLESVPGTKFVYSDVNYITLGVLVEKLSGEQLEVYSEQHIFTPLGMIGTLYHPFWKSCGQVRVFGAAVEYEPNPLPIPRPKCVLGSWAPEAISITAPTQYDNEGTAETNPDFDRLLRGTVHDPTTRRMGGVAGHAGVFSTAGDMVLFAQALLDRLAGRPSSFPLKRETLELMTRAEQPKTALADATIFTADGKATRPDGSANKGAAVRGFGWDINSGYSRPRGEVFPIGSFGHTGFTGTSLWMDPGSDSYVILLANAVHPRGNAPITTLRGQVATAAAKALGLSGVVGGEPTHRGEAAMNGARSVGGATTQVSEARLAAPAPDLESGSCPPNAMCDPLITAEGIEIDPVDFRLDAMLALPDRPNSPRVATGIDVLEATQFAALKEAARRHGGKLRVGLLTNQTGVDGQGRRTIDVLQHSIPEVELVKLFSPEHGIFGAKDSTEIGQEVDAASGLKVTSLYGAKDSDRRPKPEDLKGLDAVVIDLQDAGVRFYTYETVVGYFLEAASAERGAGHAIEVIVLDRPGLVGATEARGPMSDPGKESYTNYMPEPVQLGMTIGELAKFIVGERIVRSGGGSSGKMGAMLTVVSMQNWRRSEFFDETGLKWVNPSPNLRSVTEAMLYPGVALLETTNVSVGRGTETPFEVFGAGMTSATKFAQEQPAWFDGKAVAAYLTARKIPGVTFAATKFAVAEDANKYPYHGQTIEGVRVTVTDRAALDAPEMGVEVLSALHQLYPKQFNLEKAMTLVANQETMEALERGDDPRTIAAEWVAGLDAFKERRAKYLIYP
jgi:SSS family transporter